MSALTYAELRQQFMDCGLHLLDFNKGSIPLTEIVIRTAEGDMDLAAIHREGAVLVLDLGQRRTETS